MTTDAQIHKMQALVAVMSDALDAYEIDQSTFAFGSIYEDSYGVHKSSYTDAFGITEHIIQNEPWPDNFPVEKFLELVREYKLACIDAYGVTPLGETSVE